MVGSRVYFEAHDAGDQITPLIIVIVVIFFLTDFLVVVTRYAATGYAGIVELEVQFLPAIAAPRSRNPDDVMPAVYAIR